MATNKVSAQQIYALLKPFALTMEQQRAVEDGPVDSPSLVVAGAGSGKTELMSVRVLWLVANGHARPDQVLGLTFTRKAASELSKRIYKSLLVLRDSEYWPEGLEYDFAQPNVTTYNSYANSLFRENALALGLEQESALLTEAAAFQLAREVVVKYGASIDARLTEVDMKLEPIVQAVLELAGSMNDNLVTAESVTEITQKVLASISNLPKKPDGADFTQFGYYPELLEPFGVTEVLAKLADYYRAEKYRLGYVDYSDQVALAERAVRELPNVLEQQRGRYSQILLDEYQDTSFLQTRLLAGLFKDSAVFAVGDPNQSIYGWRGASASNLANFHTDFSTGSQAEARFELSTSWRNPVSVLKLANHLAQELTVPATYLSSSAHHLVPLTLHSRSDAPAGRVQVKVDQTIEQEAESVAKWLAANLAPAAGGSSISGGTTGADAAPEPPTAAVLMRSKKWMQLFREAIEAQGLSVEVVGLGGLLELPEIIDLTSALRVIHDPSRGTELVRLLTGARWRIGPKDIDRLHRFARKQNRFHLKDESVAPEDAVSIVDALDLLLDAKLAADSGIPEPGLSRFQNAAALFANLRSQTGLPLAEFVRLVERELWLDVEVMANPRKKNPMAHLNAFAGIVAGYAQSNHRPHLGAFLKWLEVVDERERLEAPSAAPEPGVVQLLTIHASKGLEWDYVSVANLAEGDFPSEGKGTSGWLAKGALPYPLRGDVNSLPNWDYRSVQAQPELKKSVEAFKTQMREHLYREELRLVYVAVTRPKLGLLLTGSYWKPGVKKAKAASSFLNRAVELPQNEVEVFSRQPADADTAFPPRESDENPLAQNEVTKQWPLEPLGEHHGARVSHSRDLVIAAIKEGAAQTEVDQIELLLRERENRIQARSLVPLPVRINASGFKDYLLNTEQAAERMLRPLPQKPYQATRAGTVFHSIMEQRNATLVRQLTQDPDLDIADESERLWARELSSGDLAQHQATVEELQANFASSRWADKVAVEAETEIQLAVG
ncbi:MAG: ATP-dependent helicase, partial [Actinomycetales bacterium]|nr:ATP-dependent helicase [Actinomycetales bacterium]